MPSLNTLRTKGGIIVTIVIFVALIAFLVGDMFSSGSMLFNSRKMRAARIDGHNIGYEEFYKQNDYYSNIYKLMWGESMAQQQQSDMAYEAAWESFLMKYSYAPSFEKMGLVISDGERLDMVDGTYLSPVITQTFMNPNTGMLDMDYLKEFMRVANEDDRTYAVWSFLRNQMEDNRIMTKYIALVNNGFSVTDLEVEKAVKNTNETYDAQIVSKAYHTIADSLVKVTDSQIRSYYKSHKEMFKQTPSRDVEYVVFDIMPSEDDYAAAKAEMDEMAAEFAASDAPMQYATINSQVKPDTRYYGESELSTQLAGIAFGRNAGRLYGPELNGDTYTMSRLADTRMMPDSLGAKHILLARNEKALADSLVRVIRSGSNFQTLAYEFSNDQSVFQNGGDLGRFAPAQMVAEFSEAAINAKRGDVYTVESPYGLHVVELTYKSTPVRKAQIATITYKVDPSGATMQTIYNNANNFITAAAGTANGFRQAVSDEGLSKRSIRIKNTDRTISGLENSRELIRWAYNNKKGAVSQIMEIDGDYLVAALTDIKEEAYTPVEQAKDQIRTTLMNQGKARILAQEMTGATVQEIADNNDEKVTDAKVQYSAFYIQNVGVEPILNGAVSAVPAGQLSKPVEGASGVFVFSVSDIEDTAATTAEGERARLEANNGMYLGERTMQALYEESDITDMRVKFF